MKSLTFKQRVKQGVNDLFYIWKQEFRNTFRDQGMLIFFVLVPLVYPLIYSFIYTNETLRDVPAVVVDNSRTALSRDYLRRVDATPEVSIVSHCADMEEAKLALRERKGDIYILFRKFASDVAIQYRMPPITLDADARTMLENYYWRGNIRQLKNVAEQISAIEESRVITADVLRNYLPDDGSQTSMPVVMGGHQQEPQGNFERELLYKMLFDMRSEMSDIKQMLHDILAGRPVNKEQSERIAGLLQASNILPTTTVTHNTADTGSYEIAEEETEQPKEMTKAEVQRNAIIKALRKHNGRRKEAAKELFISERTLYRKIKELGINEY